jgi:dihydroorotate dehydrogenase
MTHHRQIWGTEVSNPIGIAAGFDKDGEAVDGTPVQIRNSQY